MPTKRSSSSDELPTPKRAKASSPAQDIMSANSQPIEASSTEPEIEATATASGSPLTLDHADSVEGEEQYNPPPSSERANAHERPDAVDTSHQGAYREEIASSGFEEDGHLDPPVANPDLQDGLYLDAHERPEEVNHAGDTSHQGSDREISPSGFEDDGHFDAPDPDLDFQDGVYADFGDGHETPQEYSDRVSSPYESPAPWSPPPEPFRPPNPYMRKQRFTIRRHKACPPFGRDYPDYPGLRVEVPTKILRTKTLVEVCLENPPMEGETLDDPPRTMQILEKIRVKDSGGAQLVACRLDDEPQEYAAKIYDPLYYGFSDRDLTRHPRDVVYEADHDYCREVAAYLELDDLFGGKLESVPKYYGSWTLQHSLDLPDGRKTRDVRIVLMELLEGGRTMEDIDPSPYPEDVRLEIVAQVLEIGRRISFAGVTHGDWALRNFFLCEDFPARKIKRTVMLDFNLAVVTRLDNWPELYGKKRGIEKGKPSNPIDSARDLGLMYSDFRQWLPASWNQEAAPLYRWIHERWGSSEDFSPPWRPLPVDKPVSAARSSH